MLSLLLLRLQTVIGLYGILETYCVQITIHIIQQACLRLFKGGWFKIRHIALFPRAYTLRHDNNGQSYSIQQWSIFKAVEIRVFFFFFIYIHLGLFQHSLILVQINTITIETNRWRVGKHESILPKLLRGPPVEAVESRYTSKIVLHINSTY